MVRLDGELAAPCTNISSLTALFEIAVGASERPTNTSKILCCHIVEWYCATVILLEHYTMAYISSPVLPIVILQQIC